MQNGIFGSPSKGKQGNIILNISNIIEAKLNSKKDKFCSLSNLCFTLSKFISLLMEKEDPKSLKNDM